MLSLTNCIKTFHSVQLFINLNLVRSPGKKKKNSYIGFQMIPLLSNQIHFGTIQNKHCQHIKFVINYTLVCMKHKLRNNLIVTRYVLIHKAGYEPFEKFKVELLVSLILNKFIVN